MPFSKHRLASPRTAQYTKAPAATSGVLDIRTGEPKPNACQAPSRGTGERSTQRRMLAGMKFDPGPFETGDWRRLRCQLRDDVTVTDLGDQLVLLDPRNQEMYALDDVGRFVWEALEGDTLDGVAAAVSERYGIEAPVAQRDLYDLVTELSQAELLERVDPSDSRT
jgi:hypothetical protein